MNNKSKKYTPFLYLYHMFLQGVTLFLIVIISGMVYSGEQHRENNKVILQGDFAGGEGTQSDPYLVKTALQLYTVRDYPAAYFRQEKDIDLTMFSTGKGWEPIGCDDNKFSGEYDGNGYVIRELVINRPDEYFIGLFGVLGEGGKISGVSLDGVSVEGNEEVGALVGWNDGGIITGCHVNEGQVKGFHFVGGLTGKISNKGLVKQSSSHVDVKGILGIGGMVGINEEEGTIERSFASGNVEGEIAAGGLTGLNIFGAIILNSYSRSSVKCKAASEEKSFAGGLVGVNGIRVLEGEEVHEGAGSIENSYATGTVQGKNFVAGLIGSQGVQVEVDSDDLNIELYDSLGDVKNSFWNMDIIETGVAHGDDEGAQGISTTEMMEQITFTEWDFDTVWKMSLPDSEFQGFPVLDWQKDVIYIPCNISQPDQPYGPGQGLPSENLKYATGGAECDCGSEVEFRFDWDDGTYSEWSPEISAVKSWEETGVYDIKAQARCAADNTVQSESLETTVTIQDVFAHFTASPTAGEVPLEVKFSDFSTGDISSWEWNFDDGNTSDEQSPTYTFVSTGKYSVELTVHPGGSVYSKDIIVYAAADDFAYGSGIQDDPYLLANAHHLNNVRDDPDKHFRQITDIDLSNYSDGNGWEPIGNTNNEFKGIFDGNGYEIRNLSFNGSSEPVVGLFGYVHEDGVINGITLKNIDISGSFFVGGLAGWNKGKISDCIVSGEVTGSGGLYSKDDLEDYLEDYLKDNLPEDLYDIIEQYVNNYFEDFMGMNYVGGLAGLNEGSLINCRFEDGKVTGETDLSIVGGLAGLNTDTIKDCKVGKMEEASISGGIAGGLAGLNEGHITDSNADIVVKGKGFASFLVDLVIDLFGDDIRSFLDNYIDDDDYEFEIEDLSFSGGLIGINSGNIENCAVKGSVTGEGDFSITGGLVSVNTDEIQKCTVECTVHADSYIAAIGGLAGANAGSIEDNLSDSIVQGEGELIIAGGLTGLNYADIIDSKASGKVSIQGYITSAGGLAGVSEGTIVSSSADCDVKGKGIVREEFSLIKSFINDFAEDFLEEYIDFDDDDVYTYIHNIGFAGGLLSANTNNGIVRNSHASGSVKAEASLLSAGGLCGVNAGVIEDGSYALSAVTGNADMSVIGGLAGSNSGEIRQGYASGKISATAFIGTAGGLSGVNDGSIDNSYSSGTVNVRGGKDYNLENLENLMLSIFKTLDFDIDNIPDVIHDYLSNVSITGGVIGLNNGDITNSYARGTTSGRGTIRFIGGLIAGNTGDVEKCYAGGTLSGRGNVNAIGGLIGIDYQGNISDSYYDRETTGRKDDELGIPKSTRAMKRQATFENWDFAVTWGIEEGATYPYLRWQPLYADFQANPAKGTYPLSVQFTDSSIAGTIDTWTWNFGDGHTGTGQTTSHTYTQSGTYSVSLTIEGPGGKDMIRKKSLIHVSAPPYATEFLRSSLARGLNRTRLSSFPARVLGSRRSSFGNPALSAQQEQLSSPFQAAQAQQIATKKEAYDAVVIDSEAPLLLTPGVKEELRITLKNTGKSAWKTDDAIYLAAVGEYDDLAPEEFWRMALDHDVQPGETHTFIIELYPEIVGHYITEWRLVKINHFFFGEIFQFELEVVESMLAFSGWGI